MQALLSFDKAPPFAAPLRFFLTGPLFAAAAGLLLLLQGEDLLSSRWTPGALAMTHLVTIGFMLQIMLGAVIQVLPVVAGANLAQPLRVAASIHVGLSLGGVLLAGGFLEFSPLGLTAAAGVLGGTLLAFLGAALAALLGVPATSPTIRGLQLALFGLLGVGLLGSLLALALARSWAWPLPPLADLHAGWGLAAWAGVLLAAMAYVVVPMFQLTPGYPARASWRFPWLLFSLMLTWTLGTLLEWGLLQQLAQLLLALVGAALALLTLRLQGLRRRARADATYRYWQLGLFGLLLALCMFACAAIRPEITQHPAWTPAFGILIGIGGFMPFIIGMLYKIVPFLAWLHLQNAAQGKGFAPPMNKLSPDRPADQQYLVHVIACALLLAALAWPPLARLAGATFALANLWLFWNIFSVTRRYQQHLQAFG